MVTSAIILNAFGIGESTNQGKVDVAVQSGVLNIAVVCFIGPVVEEVFFRGILFEVLAGRKNHVVRSILAVILSALIFAFMHVSHTHYSVQDLLTNIPILMMGLTVGTLRWKTDNILCSMLVHIALNSIATFG